MIRVETAKPNGVAVIEPEIAHVVSVTLPRPGMPVTMEQMEDAEHAIAISLPLMNDIREIEEQRNKIAALETYLKGKQMHMPALGAQRRLEARIGQLLGEAKVGRPEETSVATEINGVSKDDRSDFRVLARALNGKCELSKDDWRKSRRALVGAIKELTKEDDEAMLAAEIERTIESQTKPNNHLSVPEGMTAEELCRKGIAMEDGGLSSDEVAKELGMDVKSYRRMRAVILLHDRGGLSRRDATIVNHALEALNDTNQVSGPWVAVEPIAGRVWGKVRSMSVRDIEPKRLEKFDYSFGLVMQACEDAAEMDVPYLSEDRAGDAVKQLATAINHLRTLSKRIMEIHS